MWGVWPLLEASLLRHYLLENETKTHAVISTGHILHVGLSCGCGTPAEHTTSASWGGTSPLKEMIVPSKLL